MRILGLDYGEKRIGMAVCDELGMTAQGLPTLIRKTKKHDLEVLSQWI
ncbi:MAG: RuvX/YqgF family protein, partial [Syntrophaceae bacterium]|nr:RuvX/YqgF family protein [Syntrophaceae bacterium]